jgi:hypothetical protein
MPRTVRRVVLITAEKVEVINLSKKGKTRKGGVGAARPIILISDYPNHICHYLIRRIGVLLYKEFRDTAIRVSLSSGPGL